MVLNLRPELLAKLAILAAEQGCGEEAPVERLANYDAWLIAEVEKGLTAADRASWSGMKKSAS